MPYVEIHAYRVVLCPYTGPVRGVAFHPFRDLLVTGGDDYKVRVWGESARYRMFLQ